MRCSWSYQGYSWIWSDLCQYLEVSVYQEFELELAAYTGTILPPVLSFWHLLLGSEIPPPILLNLLLKETPGSFYSDITIIWALPILYPTSEIIKSCQSYFIFTLLWNTLLKTTLAIILPVNIVASCCCCCCCCCCCYTQWIPRGHFWQVVGIYMGCCTPILVDHIQSKFSIW